MSPLQQIWSNLRVKQNNNRNTLLNDIHLSILIQIKVQINKAMIKENFSFSKYRRNRAIRK